MLSRAVLCYTEFSNDYLCEIRRNDSQTTVSDWGRVYVCPCSVCVCVCVCVDEDVESRAALKALMGSVSTASHWQGDRETCPVRHGSSVSPQLEFLGIPANSDCYQIQRHPATQPNYSVFPEQDTLCTRDESIANKSHKVGFNKIFFFRLLFINNIVIFTTRRYGGLNFSNKGLSLSSKEMFLKFL